MKKEEMERGEGISPSPLLSSPEPTRPTSPSGKGERGAPKAYSKHTDTWRLFEALFLDLGEEKLPWRGEMTKGQAINLAIGLNRCQLAWARENGVPEEHLTRSAKAIRGATDSAWELEISRNYYRTGELSPSALKKRGTPLAGLVAKYCAGEGGEGEPAPALSSPLSSPPSEPSHMERLLAGAGFGEEAAPSPLSQVKGNHHG